MTVRDLIHLIPLLCGRESAAAGRARFMEHQLPLLSDDPREVLQVVPIRRNWRQSPKCAARCTRRADRKFAIALFSSQNAARVYETYWDTEWELSLPPPNPVIIFHLIPKQRFWADMILEMVQLERIRSLFSAKIVMSRRQKESEWVTCVCEWLGATARPRGQFRVYVFLFSHFFFLGDARVLSLSHHKNKHYTWEAHSLGVQHLWDREPHLTRRCQVACYI